MKWAINMAVSTGFTRDGAWQTTAIPRTRERCRAQRQCNHVTMRKGALNAEDGWVTGHGDTALQKDSEKLNELRIRLREIGKGVLDDLLLLSARLAQENGGRRVAGGDGFIVHGLHHITAVRLNEKASYPASFIW